MDHHEFIMKLIHTKSPLSIVTFAFAALSLAPAALAQDVSPPIAAEAIFGAKAAWSTLTEIQVVSFHGEALGRIQDLVLDLTNGRIVEVLVVSDQVLRAGGRTVAVPPDALIANSQNKVYQVNMGTAAFKAAPAFDLSKWDESTKASNVAAAYKYFGEVPYFLTTDKADRTIETNGSIVVTPGSFARMSKFLAMPVDNLQGQRLGTVESVVVDVSTGWILNVYIAAKVEGTPLKFSTVIPPTLLSFNSKHDGLLLDVTKVVYSEEPHVIFENNAQGQVISSREQAATTPPTNVALVQGTSFRDINTTAEIYQAILKSTFDPAQKIEVGTKEGRVTLRGTVKDQAARDGIGAIAIATVNIDNVDNQIGVMSPPQAAP